MGLFSIRPIIRLHKEALVSDSSLGYAIGMFVALPLVAAILLVLLGIKVSLSFLGLTISALAVLIGFSLNALVLLVRFVQSPSEEVDSEDSTEESEGDDNNDQNRRDKLQELIYQSRVHIHYSLIIGFGIILLIGGLHLAFSNNLNFGIPGELIIVSILVFSVLIHYILTLLLIPARLYVIVENS